MPPGDYLLLMLGGYTLTAAVETAVLFVGLSRRHRVKVRLFAGLWLSACTYPVVWLVLPYFFQERTLYLLVAESFAPATECLLFWLAFLRGRPHDPRATTRDLLTIVLANLISFALGELIYATIW